MTHAERAVRLNEIQVLAEAVLAKMTIGVEEQGFDDDEELLALLRNERLVKQLIAKARALGKDFSSVIR